MSKMDIAAFRRAVTAQLRRNLTGWTIEDAEDDPEGIDTTPPGDTNWSQRVGLHNFYLLYANGHETLEQVLGTIARHTADFYETTRRDAPGEADFATVADRLRVQLRRKSMAAEIAASFAEHGWPDQPPTPEYPGPLGLFVCPAIDQPDSMMFVTGKHLEMWGQTAESIRDRAIAQTRAALAASSPERVIDADDLTLDIYAHDVDGFTGTRILFPDLLGAPSVPGETATLVLATDRDFVAVLRGPVLSLPPMVMLLQQINQDRGGYPHPLYRQSPLVLMPDLTLAPLNDSDVVARVVMGRAMNDFERRTVNTAKRVANARNN